MKRLPNGRLAVDPEAVSNMTDGTPPGPCLFTMEDLEHLEDLILEACEREDLISCPGAEHVYAKIFREIKGHLPPVHEE